MSDLLIEFLGGSKVGQQIYMEAEDLVGLESFLQRLRHEEPLFVNMVLRQGNELTVGIGATRSCIQHSGKEHWPPYLMAQEPLPLLGESEIEFDAGGTTTPILISRSVPTELAIRLVLDIVRTETLPSYVDWVEI